MQNQRRSLLHHHIPDHVNRISPYHLPCDPSGPPRYVEVHHHILPASPDALHPKSGGTGSEGAVVAVARRIRLQGERGVPLPIEQISRVSQVPSVRFPIGYIVCPEVQVVPPGDRVRHPVRIEQSIRTLQIHPLIPFLCIVRSRRHVPDQQSTPRYVPVVVPTRGRPMFDQEVFRHHVPPVRQGNPIHLPVVPYASDDHIFHVLHNIDHIAVTFSDPSQLLPTPRTHRIRSIVPVPSQRTSSHQPPLPNTRTVFLRRLIPIEQKGYVVQIRQTQPVPELMRHHSHCMGKTVCPLHCAQHVRNHDHAASPRGIVRRVVHRQSQGHNPCRRLR